MVFCSPRPSLLPPPPSTPPPPLLLPPPPLLLPPPDASQCQLLRATPVCANSASAHHAMAPIRSARPASFQAAAARFRVNSDTTVCLCLTLSSSHPSFPACRRFCVCRPRLCVCTLRCGHHLGPTRTPLIASPPNLPKLAADCFHSNSDIVFRPWPDGASLAPAPWCFLEACLPRACFVFVPTRPPHTCCLVSRFARRWGTDPLRCSLHICSCARRRGATYVRASSWPCSRRISLVIFFGLVSLGTMW